MDRYKRLRLKMLSEGPGLRPGESPYSTNLVTGFSLNFPIASTCSPSKLCGATCYAGCGPITWSASIAKQYRNLSSCKHDPYDYANLVVKDYHARKMSFIVWNGSGDLFDESVTSINAISKGHPEIPQWVRTRKPRMASQIEWGPNTWVHFSLDRESMDRRSEVEWKTFNHFYSYQYAPFEEGRYPEGVDVVFGHDYKMPEGVGGPEVCPLNKLDDIANACDGCRRCLGG